jgi:hypothetical protein
MFPSPVALSGNLAVLKGPSCGSGEYLFLRFPSEARGIPERVWHLDLDCERIEMPFVSTILRISSFSQG